MALKTKRYFKDELNQGALQRLVQLGATTVGSVRYRTDIEVDDATADIDETADEFMSREGYSFEEDNPASTLIDIHTSLVARATPQTITPGAGLEEVGIVVSNPSLYAPLADLGNMFLRAYLVINTNDTDGRIQIVETDYTTPEDKFAVDAPLPDTGGDDAVFEVDTDVALRAGTWAYILRASTAVTGTLSIRSAVLTLMRNA